MTFNRWRVAGLTGLVLLISSSMALPLVADDCSGVAAYVSGTVYTGGQQAVYNSQLWKAKWWTQNETPSTGGSGVWQFMADCSGGGGGNTTPAGYTWCANENGSYTFGQTVDVAYGANGVYVYKTGVSGAVTFNNATFGDPISGVAKAGYYKNAAAVGPAGYTWCAGENGSYTFNTAVDVAYGANGSFVYKTGVTGAITFNNATFGDPAFGVAKAGYYKDASNVGPAGYTWCAGENGSYTFSQAADVAYGANGAFFYKTGITGAISFNNATFGDPISGVAKAGYYKNSDGGGDKGDLTLGEATNPNGRYFAGYYPTWSDNWFSVTKWDGTKMSDNEIYTASNFAKIPAVYTHVKISFGQPNFSWNGLAANNWSGTGINFNGTPADIKEVIRILHLLKKKVILAVGGATYNSWGALCSEAGTNGPTKTALTNFMKDMGVDGLDVDYEVAGVDANSITNYAKAIQAMREACDAAGSGKLLTMAAWSTGADYTSATGAGPNGISYWGGDAGRERLTFAKTCSGGSRNGQKIVNLFDVCDIMSYDAQTLHYDPVTAFEQYRAMMPSSCPVAIGLEIPPEGWSGGMLVLNNGDQAGEGTYIAADQYGRTGRGAYSVERFANVVKSNTVNTNPHDGLMLWQILKTTSPTNANATSVAAKVSTMFK